MTDDKRGSSGVPEGWQNVRLEDIASIKSGGTPSRAQGKRYFDANGTPWVKTMDLNNGYIDRTNEAITDEALEESACSVFPKGSVLVAMYGGYNQIGRTGLLRLDAAVNQAISALQINLNDATSEYVLHWLNTHVDVWKQFAASSRKDPNITRKDVCDFPILLPPLEEQREIAEILSVWDEAIEQQTRLLELKHERKRGLMQQLLTGRVRFKEFTGLEWEMAELGSLLNCLGNGLTYDTEQTEGAKVTRIETISAGVVNTSKVGYTVQTDELERYRLRRGDILYSHINSLSHIGKVAYFDIDDALYHGMNLLLLRPNEKIANKYLYYLLTSSPARKQALSNAKNAVNQASINTKELRKFTFSLPSLPEQQKIATVLSAADAEIETLTAQLAALKSQKRGLMQQLLTGKTRVQLA